MPYEYFSDEEHIREWLTVEKDPEAFEKFIDENIYQCETHFDYLRLHGGMEKMWELRQKELFFANSENGRGGE